MINTQTAQHFSQVFDSPTYLGCLASESSGAKIIDAGVNCGGGLEAGLFLAQLCMGGLAKVRLTSISEAEYGVSQGVWVQTDQPIMSCLGCQYAGWPVQTDDFFAMGSGPMRLARGREEVLGELKLSESVDVSVGVLESEVLPTEAALRRIADDCGVTLDALRIAVAPSTSIAGSIQVVARSIETALHKMHELKFDVSTIISATGIAPLLPPAKRGDIVNGIGRTNDSILYGATVTLWVDHDDDELDDVIERVPSTASPDHGQPFAKIFKQYDYDFYKDNSSSLDSNINHLADNPAVTKTGGGQTEQEATPSENSKEEGEKKSEEQ